MLNSGISNIKVFACNSNKTLANAIADKLGLKLGDCEVEKFSDGEISVKINETIRGADVFIIQSTSYPVNDNLMELLIMIDAMKRASAARITAVITDMLVRTEKQEREIPSVQSWLQIF